MTAPYTPVPVEDAVARAAAANRLAGRWDRAQADDAVAAVGWQLYDPASVRELTGLAFEETGLGNADHLFELHRRRVLGALHDRHGMRSLGLIGTDVVRGTEQYARPVGVIAMLSPALSAGAGNPTVIA
jgi:sulfoacetaldehyde dehydrogenase